MRLEHSERNDGPHPNPNCHDLLHYTEAFNGRKLQIVVHWDRNYAIQSYAKVLVWSHKDAEWHMVAHLLPHQVIDLDTTADLVQAIAGAVLFDPERDGD
jgi:hypothetical protein